MPEIKDFDWYHRIDLGPAGVTPGWAPLFPEEYLLPEDMSGARVLDIGTFDGYWAFEAIRRGADRVIAIDDFSDFMGLADDKQDRSRTWEKFHFCRDSLGIPERKCKAIKMSGYDIRDLGRFDIVMCLGVLYHCRHPLLMMDVIREVCNDTACFETHIADDFSPYLCIGEDVYGLADLVDGRPVPLIEFYPTDQLAGNPTNWFGMNFCAFNAMLYAAGFNHIKSKKVSRPSHLSRCRAYAECKV